MAAESIWRTSVTAKDNSAATKRGVAAARFADVTAVTHRARVAPELTGRWAVGDSMAVWARYATTATPRRPWTRRRR